MTQWGLDTLFNPAKRHMDEEKQRLQATRAEVGDSSGGKRIDLASGKVTISRSQPKDAPAEDDTEDDGDLVDEVDDPAGADAADAADVAELADSADETDPS